MDSTKYDTVLTKTIRIEPRNINEDIETITKKHFGNHFSQEGYILSDSIKIIRRSAMRKFPNHLDGSMAIDVVFSASLLLPVKGNAITGKISGINKAGFLIDLKPFLITVLIEQHENKALFKDLKVGDEVKVIVVATKYNQRNNTMIINAKFEEEFNRKLKIKVKSKKGNQEGGDDEDLLEKAYNEELPNEESNSVIGDDIDESGYDEEPVDEEPGIVGEDEEQPPKIDNETGQEEFEDDGDEQEEEEQDEPLEEDDEDEDDETAETDTVED